MTIRRIEVQRLEAGVVEVGGDAAGHVVADQNGAVAWSRSAQRAVADRVDQIVTTRDGLQHDAKRGRNCRCLERRRQGSSR